MRSLFSQNGHHPTIKLWPSDDDDKDDGDGEDGGDDDDSKVW